jgi:hypothetical protein
MPRRARRRPDDVPPLSGSLAAPVGEDGFVVRPARGEKTYRCPGCDQEIVPGLPHVVSWPEHDASDRRHWHTPCWRSRERRGVKVHRAKNAPRYG